MEITTPAVDLYEEQDEIVVKAELPGMEKDNIEVNLSDDRLTIKGEKKASRGSQRIHDLQNSLEETPRLANGFPVKLFYPRGLHQRTESDVDNS